MMRWSLQRVTGVDSRIATFHSSGQTCAYLASAHPTAIATRRFRHRALPSLVLSSKAMPTIEVTKSVAPMLTAPRLRRLLFVAAALIVLALDQASKELVRTLLERGESWPDAWPVRLHYVTNTGAAFGILKDQTGFLVVTTIIGLGAIYLYYRYPPFDHVVAPIAMGMMLGGAVGNLVDRLRLGRVTDFIDFPFWPSFNVADSSIVIGVAILLLGYAMFAKRPPPGAEREDAGPNGR
jgi:signal peptidase II